MLYRSSGIPFGSSPLLLPSVGIRCHEVGYGAFYIDSYHNVIPGSIQNISDCQIINQSNFCPVRDRLGISCGGTDILLILYNYIYYINTLIGHKINSLNCM